MHSCSEDLASCPRLSSRGSKRKVRESVRAAAKNTLLDQALGPSSAPLKGCGGGSARSKDVQILSDAPRDILPHMKVSFVERRYLPSISMDQSKWEMILEQLVIMGYIVKEESCKWD
jgi:hypothetical protein